MNTVSTVCPQKLCGNVNNIVDKLIKNVYFCAIR
ncbi:hypothetical protein HNQ80_004912 [Anaerosolibacter carboniphilus]|uniref:Uncharacterized protein n=1 Tax=Anaerosolibacter carboniphilus TaxID=1417629 RepID=A0A841KZF2_9FIRM|nr:hypothetical protein [Anaerosolibacter carboniphilus]